MTKVTCVLSQPVIGVTDELMTSLLKAMPEDKLAAILEETLLAAMQRLPTDRHAHYKATKLMRRMTERLSDPPHDLRKLLGMEVISKDDLTVFGLEDLPKFEDFAYIFDEYPYIAEDTYEGSQSLVVGYLSGRSRHTDALVRRNCQVDGVTFKDLFGMLTLENTRDGVHRFVKLFKWRPGTKIRCWTNVKPKEGKAHDEERYNRYLVCKEGGGFQVIETREEFDNLAPPENIQRQIDAVVATT